jgi:GTP-binding protein
VPPIELTFLTSAPELGQLQHSHAEVAVVGRSNVGKSSLINALANRRQLARTSGTPGRTQLLNQFAARGGGTLVDLPGYGYAKAPVRVRDEWQRRMRRYLLERDVLVDVLVLVDGAVGPTALDVDMLSWLREHDRPVTVVATKHDKVRSSKRQRRQRDLASGCGVPPGDVLWVSASSGHGIDPLRDHIRRALS